MQQVSTTTIQAGEEKAQQSLLSLYLPEIAFIVLSFLLVLALFGRVLVQPGAVPFINDFDYYHGLEVANRGALTAGEWPLWNPYLSGGLPGMANPQQIVLYPPAVLARLLQIPTIAFFNWSAIFHIWLAILGMAAFGRSQGLSRLSSVLMGLSYGLGGAIVPRMIAGHIPWIHGLPWLGWLLASTEMLHKARPDARPAWVLLSTLALVLLGLSGHPQVVILLAAIPSVWWGLRLSHMLVQRQGMQALQTLGLLALPVLLAGLLMALQLLPSLELYRLSERAEGVRETQADANRATPEHLATLVAPLLFYSIDSYSRIAGAEMHEVSMYIGLGPLLLALLALSSPYPGLRRPARWAVAFSLLSLVLALGNQTPLYKPVLTYLSFFRWPGRWLLWLIAGLTLASGLGAETLLRLRADNPALLRRLLRWAAGAFGVAGVVAALVLLPALSGSWPSLGERLAATATFTATAGEIVSTMRRAMFVLSLTALIWAACIAALALLDGEGRKPLPWMLVLALALDLLIYAWPLVPALPGRNLFANPDLPIARLAIDPAEVRLGRYEPLRFGPSYGVPILGEGETFLPGRTVNLLQTQFGASLYASYFQVHPDLAGFPSEAVRASAPEAYLLETGFNYPRLYAAPAVEILPDDASLLERVGEQAFDPEAAVFSSDSALAALLPAQAPAMPYQAHYSYYGSTHLSAEIETEQPVMLVFAENWYPGWQARVDGQPADIWRVNYNLRGVIVPQGEHLVAMDYQPQSVRIGAWLSGAGLLISLGLAAWGLFRLIRLRG